MSDIKDILTDIIKFAGDVITEAHENPVRVAITAEMFRSFVNYASKLNYNPKTPEEELSNYKANSDFLEQQLALAKQKLES